MLTDVFTADTSSLFILVLAVVGITGEWRHRTIAGALLAAPDRVRFLAAKTVAFAAAGLALSLATSLTVAVVASVLLSARDLPLRPGRSPSRSRATRWWRRCSARSASPRGHSCATRWPRSSACSCSRSRSSPPCSRSPPRSAAGARGSRCPGSVQDVPPEELGLGKGTPVAAGVAVLAMWPGLPPCGHPLPRCCGAGTSTSAGRPPTSVQWLPMV